MKILFLLCLVYTMIVPRTVELPDIDRAVGSVLDTEDRAVEVRNFEEGAYIETLGVTVGAEEDLWDVTVDGNSICGTYYADEDDLEPGAEGEAEALIFTGKNEEAVTFEVSAWLGLLEFEVAGEYYCPIDFIVGDTVYSGMDYSSDYEFECAVEEAVEDYYGREFSAGTYFEDIEPVKWKWAYSGGYLQDGEKDAALCSADLRPDFFLELTCEIVPVN